MTEPSRHDMIDQRHRQRRNVTLAALAIALAAGITMLTVTTTSSSPPAKVTSAHATTTTTRPAAATTTTTTPTAAPIAATTTTTGPTVYLPVTPGSGAGCVAGITDGTEWIRYTVHPGDSLFTIAACFDLNGYDAIYQQNVGIIGANPSLIHPGQVFTITLPNRLMTPSQP